MSIDGEAQAMEAQFDGADGEAAPSADYQELEDLSLEELVTAEPLIEGLQELQDAIQDSEFRAKQRDKQLIYVKAYKDKQLEFKAKKRDKQLAQVLIIAKSMEDAGMFDQ
jgi:hypothetical protein